MGRWQDKEKENVVNGRWQIKVRPPATPIAKDFRAADNKSMDTYNKKADLDKKLDVIGQSPINRTTRLPQAPSNEGNLLDAITAGAGQADLGIINTARMINKPVAFLGNKIEEVVTGKKIEPNSDPLSRGLDNLTNRVEKDTQYFQNKLANKQGLERLPYDVASGITGMLPSLVSGNLIPLVTQAFGSGAREAENKGANFGQQVAYGGMSAGVEALTEAIPFEKLQKVIKGNRSIKDIGIGMLGEFIGEGLSEGLSPFIKASTYTSEYIPRNSEQVLELAKNMGQAGLTGAMTSLVLSGLIIGSQTANDSVKNNDYSPEAVEQVKKEVEQITGVKTDTQPITPIQQEISQNVPLNDVQTNINKMSQVELIQNLQQQNLDTTGTKAELRNRLKDATSKKPLQVVDTNKTIEPIGSTEQLQKNTETLPNKVDLSNMTNNTPQINPLNSNLDTNAPIQPQNSFNDPLNNIQEQIKPLEQNTLDDSNKIIEQTDFDGLDTSIEQISNVEELTKLLDRAKDILGTTKNQMLRMNLQMFADKVQDKINKINTDKNFNKVQATKETEQQKSFNKLTTLKDTYANKIQATKEVEQQKSFNKLATLKDIGTNKIQATKETEQQKAKMKLDTLKDVSASKIQATKEIEQQKAFDKITKLIDKYDNKIQATKETGQQKTLIAKEKGEKKLTVLKDKVAQKEEVRKVSRMQTDLLKKVKDFKKQELNPEIQAIANEIFGEIDDVSKSISPKKRAEFEQTLKNIEKLESEGVSVEQDIKDSIARLNRKQIASMDAGEVQELLDIAKYIKHLNSTKNKLNRIKSEESATKTANKMVQSLEEKPSNKAIKAKKTGAQVENSSIFNIPDALVGKQANTINTMMLEVGRGDESSPAYKIAESINDAQNVEIKNKHDLHDLLARKVGDYQKLFASKEWTTKQNIGGKKLSSGEKIYLKYSVNDKNVSESLREKGARQKGDISPTRYNDEFIKSIQLNKSEMDVYNALADFFEETYQLLNKEHIALNNYTLRRTGGRGDYLPKVVSDITLREELGQMFREGLIKNTGIVQKRKGSINELILPDVADIITRQMEIASKYNAYAVLNQDLSKIFSKPKLRQALRNEYGVGKTKDSTSKPKSIVEEMINDLMQDLQGTKINRTNSVERSLKTIRTKAAPAILSYRATTPLLQTASYPMAVTVLSPDSLAKGLAKKGNYDEAMQYNERAWIRQDQGIDRELAESNVKKFTETGMKPIKFMDKATIGKLWEATKIEVKKNKPNLSSEQILVEAGKLFDRVLDTQPNYTTANRSMTMRTSSEVTKAFTMFSSAKSAVLNELKQGYIKGKYTGDWSQMGRALSGYAVSVGMMTSLSSLLKKIGGDGDEETILEALVKKISGSLPGLDTLNTLINGYDIGNMGVDAIQDLFKGVSSFYNLIEKKAKGEDVTEQSIVKTFWQNVDAIALLTGIPVENIRNDLKLIINLPEFLGLDKSDTQTQFKRFTDPFTKTEYYKEISKQLSNNKLGSIEPLLKQAKVNDVKMSGLLQSLKNRVKKEELGTEQYKKILPILEKKYFKDEKDK